MFDIGDLVKFHSLKELERVSINPKYLNKTVVICKIDKTKRVLTVHFKDESSPYLKDRFFTIFFDGVKLLKKGEK